MGLFLCLNEHKDNLFARDVVYALYIGACDERSVDEITCSWVVCALEADGAIETRGDMEISPRSKRTNVGKWHIKCIDEDGAKILSCFVLLSWLILIRLLFVLITNMINYS